MKTQLALWSLGLGSLLLLSCASSSSSGQGKPVAGTVNVEAVYAANCAKCHGDNGKANTVRGLLSGAQDFTKPTWQKDSSDADIIEAINDGTGLMPAFGKKLRGSEMNALVGYVRRFRN